MTNSVNGFIVLDRRILDWEWYKNPNTMRLFIHCLLSANWKDGCFEGMSIPRGAFVTSIRKLSSELNLSERNIRTAIHHLKKTGEIDTQTTSKFTVITVKNYAVYQSSDKQVTSKRQASDKQTTTIEQGNKGNKGKNNSVSAKIGYQGRDNSDVISQLERL